MSGCERRRRTGTCDHDQCPYVGQTAHGYLCVEIIDGYCEMGLNCIPECEYSYPIDTPGADKADEIFCPPDPFA